MKYYIVHKAFYNEPVHLTSDQMKYPFSVLQSFFTAYHLSEIRQLLSESLEMSLTANGSYFQEPGDRETLMVFHNHLLELLEANFLLLKNEGMKESPP
jgi:hypothetical protein